MAQTLFLDDIAERNDMVLLDTNSIASANEVFGKRDDHSVSQLNRMPIEGLVQIYETSSFALNIIRNHENIAAINEVLIEKDKFTEHLKRIATAAKISNIFSSTQKKDRLNVISDIIGSTDEIGVILKNRIVKKGLVWNRPGYTPAIQLVHIAAELMPLFSPKPKHRIVNPSNNTDEMLVAMAFALSAKQNGRIALVSYDSRIPYLIEGAYSLIMGADFLVPSDLARTVLDNKIFPYSFSGQNVQGQYRLIEKEFRFLNLEELHKERPCYLFDTNNGRWPDKKGFEKVRERILSYVRRILTEIPEIAKNSARTEFGNMKNCS